MLARGPAIVAPPRVSNWIPPPGAISAQPGAARARQPVTLNVTVWDVPPAGVTVSS